MKLISLQNTSVNHEIQAFVAVRWENSLLCQFDMTGELYKQFGLKAKRIAMSPAGI
jgi:hypothetical protein